MTALYVHLPFCASKCHYCAFSVVTGTQDQEAYTTALLAELQSYAPLQADTIYIGGGTPSLMAPHLLEALFVALPSAQEVSFECNPEQVTPDLVSFLRGLGVTRISLGVQTFHEQALKGMNRHHTAEQARNAMEILSQSGLSWNADLILGLPGVDGAQTAKDLEIVLSFDPHHVSAYFLSIEPGTVLAAMPHEASEEASLQVYTHVCSKLQAAGYDHTELSNWSKPGHACRHNLHYWRAEDYLGVGLGASSLLRNTTWTNTRNLRLYLQGQWRTEDPTILDAEDRLNLLLTTATRLGTGLPWDRLEPLASASNLLYLRRKAESLAAQGLLEPPEQAIILKESAYPLHDAITRYLVV